MEPVARKTAGFLVSVQLSQLGAGNRQKTRCAYQCEIAPWWPSLLVVSRPCSSATSGSQRATAAAGSPRQPSATSSARQSNQEFPDGSSRILPGALDLVAGSATYADRQNLVAVGVADESKSNPRSAVQVSEL